MSNFTQKIVDEIKYVAEQEDGEDGEEDGMDSAGIDKLEFTEDGVKVVVNKSEDTIKIGSESLSIGSFQDLSNQVDEFVDG